MSETELRGRTARRVLVLVDEHLQRLERELLPRHQEVEVLLEVRLARAPVHVALLRARRACAEWADEACAGHPDAHPVAQASAVRVARALSRRAVAERVALRHQTHLHEWVHRGARDLRHRATIAARQLSRALGPSQRLALFARDALAARREHSGPRVARATADAALTPAAAAAAALDAALTVASVVASVALLTRGALHAARRSGARARERTDGVRVRHEHRQDRRVHVVVHAEVEIRNRLALVLFLSGGHLVFDEDAAHGTSVFLERSEAALAGSVPVAMGDGCSCCRRRAGTAAVLFGFQNAATRRRVTRRK